MMEGILLDTVAFEFTTAVIHGAILIAAATGAFFGYMEEEERAGARLTWADWPVYGKIVAPPVERELKIAA